MFSRACQYGIQATILLSIQPNGKLFSIKDMAQKLNVPMPYLAKTLQSLSSRGILTSVKGPHGGFKLGKAPEDITVLDIIECFGGMKRYERCVIGFEKCGSHNLCPLHDAWRNHIKSIFEQTIKELDERLIDKRPDVVEKALFH